MFAQIYDSRDPLDLSNSYTRKIHTVILKEFEEWLYPVHVNGYQRRVQIELIIRHLNIYYQGLDDQYFNLTSDLGSVFMSCCRIFVIDVTREQSFEQLKIAI